MALFGKTGKTGVERVSGALKVFHDTALELDKGIEEIDSEKALIRQQIRDLQSQENSLDDTKIQALNASNKIKAILG